MMYAVVRYFNYRKDVSFEILKLFTNVKRADKYAFELAEEDFGDDVMQGVSEEVVYVENIIESYTKDDGYDEWVYAVVKVNSEENKSEDSEDSESEDSDESESEDSDESESEDSEDSESDDSDSEENSSN